ncbi:hypothetical protein [Rhodococcoides fascians]|uniref:hypothetical protein n=1 Tax=Rhodococcoides fascians TaxID=1828 RepID=UPI00050BE9C0|nr:hypothetical protein [Rhodococcus fascians]
MTDTAVQVIDGIDTRIEVVEKPRPDAPNWDWIVRFAKIQDSASRRFRSEQSAREYAREMTGMLDESGGWAAIDALATTRPVNPNEKADNA